MELTLLDALRCPQPGGDGPLGQCEGRLGVVPGGESRNAALVVGLVRCKRCSAAYPVLAGVPILVPDPALYVGGHRDAVLAALAEVGEATPAALEIVDALADAAGAVESLPFADDWTRNELERHWPLPPAAATFGGHAFQTFLGEADKRRPEQVLAGWLSQGRRGKAGWVIDVGCGTGVVARALSSKVKQLIVADRSLRAVLRARAAVGPGPSVHALVADAQALPLRKAGFDAIVAAQLVDLLDDPGAFLAACAHCLRRRGALLLSTPAADLAQNNGAILRGWLAAAGLSVARQDTVPWIRAHHERHFQVYFSELFLARCDEP